MRPTTPNAHLTMIAALSAVLFFLGTAHTASALAVRPQELLVRDATCPANVPLSCSAPSLPSGVDKCCFETPGGVLLLTQFWDYAPSNGPTDEFTIHGLWPDNCDGTYEASCDASLNIKGSVQSIVQDQFGDSALYSYMSGHWKGLNGDEDLWTHEFNKHGTCINTIRPDCYPSYKANQNIYDFFRITTELHKTLPTYKYLAAAGITPSSSKTYTKQQIQDALDAGFGHKVYFTCDTAGALNQIWYFHHLQGSLLGQQFKAIDTLNASGCKATGIKYPPKSGAPEPSTSGTPTSSTSTSSGPTPTGGSGSGSIKAGANPGCLISGGKYYEKGTCATFHYATGSLSSSKGACGVTDAGIACGSGNSAAWTVSGGQVSVDGVSDWCFGAASGSPPQTAVLLARNGACSGKSTFKLTV